MDESGLTTSVSRGGPTHPFLVSVTFDNMAGLDPVARALFVLRLRMCVAKATGLE